MTTVRPVIYEVGPRDGLQNEPIPVSTAAKIALIDGLSDAGLPVIEATAFVRADRVPGMADAADVLAGITRRPGTRYAALVPNLAGLERALAARADIVAVFAAATETFSRRNINQSIGRSLLTYREITRDARRAGVPVRGYLSVAFGCPFEGDVHVDRVVDLAQRMLELGVYEVAVSDTIGVAHPAQVQTVTQALLSIAPADRFAFHFHDTRGMAIANVLTALQLGIRTFDSSAGGLGGCPYAPGATGNVATEDLLYLVRGLGHDLGISLDGVADASLALESVLGHVLPSRSLRAIASARRRAASDEPVSS